MGACRFLHWLPPDDGTGKYSFTKKALPTLHKQETTWTNDRKSMENVVGVDPSICRRAWRQLHDALVQIIVQVVTAPPPPLKAPFREWRRPSIIQMNGRRGVTVARSGGLTFRWSDCDETGGRIKSNQIKSNLFCSKHITFKCSKW